MIALNANDVVGSGARLAHLAQRHAAAERLLDLGLNCARVELKLSQVVHTRYLLVAATRLELELERLEAAFPQRHDLLAFSVLAVYTLDLMHWR